MSAYYNAHQVLNAVAQQERQLSEQEARLRSLSDWHRQQRNTVNADFQLALREFGAALLPGLDAASIAHAAQLTGLSTLVAERIPEQIAANRAQLEATMRRVLADPRYQQRELLRHPRTGTLPRQLAELGEYRRPWAEVVRVCEAHPRFQRLVDTGFGTNEYTGSWWRLSYYQDRGAAHEVLQSFPGKTEFAEVRADYLQAKDTVAKLDAELWRVHQEIAAGETLDREYADAYAAHQTLDERWLAHVRDRLVRHVASVDSKTLAPTFDREPALRTLFLRTTGLGHKLSYLDAMIESKMRDDRAELGALRDKMGKIRASQNRKPVGMPADKFAATFKDRRPRWDKGWQRFGKGYQRVVVYDRYHYAPFGSDYLWWDLMTDGRVDGRYVPEVRDFYDRHPGYVYERPRQAYRPEHDTVLDDGLAHEDVDAAAAAIESDRTGGSDTTSADVGGVDGS